jgi:hypothetical protein
VSRECSSNWEKKNAYKLLVRKPEGRDHWENKNIGEWIILE